MVPTDTPVMTPDDEPTLAMDEFCVLHTPPVVGSVTFIVAPRHTIHPDDGQPMLPGIGFTVSIAIENPVEPPL